MLRNGTEWNGKSKQISVAAGNVNTKKNCVCYTLDYVSPFRIQNRVDDSIYIIHRLYSWKLKAHNNGTYTKKCV